MHGSVLDDAGIDLMFANAYHWMIQPGAEVVKALGGARDDGTSTTGDHGWWGVSGVLARRGGGDSSGKELKSRNVTRHKRQSLLLGVSEEGATFRSYRDGTKMTLTPESSVAAQKAIGADIIIPLDELPPYDVSGERLRDSVERSHRWMERSLREHLRDVRRQAMYGVVHGGVDKELRRMSVEFLAGLPFDGMAIGGSLGRDSAELDDLLRYLMPLSLETVRTISWESATWVTSIAPSLSASTRLTVAIPRKWRDTALSSLSLARSRQLPTRRIPNQSRTRVRGVRVHALHETLARIPPPPRPRARTARLVVSVRAQPLPRRRQDGASPRAHLTRRRPERHPHPCTVTSPLYRRPAVAPAAAPHHRPFLVIPSPKTAQSNRPVTAATDLHIDPRARSRRRRRHARRHRARRARRNDPTSSFSLIVNVATWRPADAEFELKSSPCSRPTSGTPSVASVDSTIASAPSSLDSCNARASCARARRRARGGGDARGSILSTSRDQGVQAVSRARLGLTHAPNFNYNVSHEGDYVVLASETHAVVGVDVAAPAQVRAVTSWPDGQRRGACWRRSRPVLTDRERAVIEEKTRRDGERAGEELFRKHWSLKEAHVKAIGVGLGMDLRRCEF